MEVSCYWSVAAQTLKSHLLPRIFLRNPMHSGPALSYHQWAAQGSFFCLSLDRTSLGPGDLLQLHRRSPGCAVALAGRGSKLSSPVTPESGTHIMHEDPDLGTNWDFIFSKLTPSGCRWLKVQRWHSLCQPGQILERPPHTLTERGQGCKQ